MPQFFDQHSVSHCTAIFIPKEGIKNPPPPAPTTIAIVGPLDEEIYTAEARSAMPPSQPQHASSCSTTLAGRKKQAKTLDVCVCLAVSAPVQTDRAGQTTEPVESIKLNTVVGVVVLVVGGGCSRISLHRAA